MESQGPLLIMLLLYICSALEGVLQREYRVHVLSDAQIRQLFERGPRFLEYVSDDKWKNVINIAEAWVYLNHTKRRRRIYYESIGKRTGWTMFWETSQS
jgi:hypothetical protein